MSNVTSLTDRLPRHTPIRHPETRRLFRYWERLRGERQAPEKEELDLRELGELVPWLGLLENQPGAMPAGPVPVGDATTRGGHVWRLTGSGITMLLGAGLEGTLAFADWEAFEFGTLQRMLRNLASGAQPFVATLRLKDHLGTLKTELLALPVRNTIDGGLLALLALLPLEEHHMLFGPAGGGELLSLRTIWTTPVPARRARPAPAAASYPPFTVIPGGRAEH